MELVNIKYLGTTDDYQRYSVVDKSLISHNFVNASFGLSGDYIEYFIYDLNGTLISANYNATQYQIGSALNPQNGLTTELFLDPEADVRRAGYDRGSTVIKYNFFRKQLTSQPGNEFWIKEISTSRTEIKVARQDLSNSDLSSAFDSFNTALTSDNYYPDFYLNFGNDVDVIGINAVYVEEDGTAYLIFKLYEPLPDDFGVKSKFWVVTKIAEPARYQVDIEIEAEAVVDQFRLRGPNYNVEVNQVSAQTTPYYTYTSLFTTTVTSSYQQLQSWFDEKGININVDYSSFDNFIHFSSATERINNFVYKLGLIEVYQSSSAALRNVTTPGAATNTSITSSIAAYQSSINNIIAKFDPYEYYLYYSSASTAWPKANTTKPYVLYPTTSSQALNWLGGVDTLPTATSLSILYSSSLYDNLNSDCLRYTAPSYIKDDSTNEPYLVFLDMIGQHFDNIWIYYKDVTNRYSAENNPNVGISLDLVGDALKGLGMELYTNTNVSDNIYYSLLGINPDGSLLPPTGSEKITNYVTSSIATLPAATIEAEIYKRLYHNLPYLLKTKGTERGIRALIACYGIPNSTLTVNEFGGYNIYSQGDLLGIQDNKIYTGSVTELSASLLSPFTTIQNYVNNTERNSYAVEVGFSPADSINNAITGSLPNLSIQQLIGSPGYQYSSSYGALDAVKNQYFVANYNTGSVRYNVWDFIRVIKYYNNSLFKLVKDFVPARASLRSGIIIKPHTLERNKYARHEPSMTTSSYNDDIKMVKISGSDADVIKYSTAWSSSVQTVSGSVPINNSYGFEKYTGQFGGSKLNPVRSGSFPQYESTYQPSQASGSFTKRQFVPVSYLLNNVTSSVKSLMFYDLDYSSNQAIPVNYNLITQSINNRAAALASPYTPFAELQQYNYEIQRSTRSRYSGSRLIGAAYNSHSIGDISYGLDPVINYNTNKLGLFTQMQTSSLIPGVVNVSLAYLADVSGGLFELNQNNRNWVEVQNTFKAGSTLTVKQFDNKKYTNQKASDGVKAIYNSGYHYTPELYFVSGADPRLYFQYTGESTTVSNFIATNTLNPNAYISGSSASPTYAVTIETPATRAGNIYKIFDTANPTTDYTAGTVSAFPTYSASTGGQKTFTVNLDVYFEFPDPSVKLTSGSYSFGVYLNPSTLIGTLQTVNFTSSYTPSSVSTGSITSSGTISPSGTPTKVGAGGWTFKGPFLWLNTSTGITQFIGSCSSSVTASAYTWTGFGTGNGILFDDFTSDLNGYFDRYDESSPTLIPTYQSMQGGCVTTPATSVRTATKTISYTTPAYNLSPGDKVGFRFRQSGMSEANFTSSISVGSLGIGTVAVGAGGYPYASTGSGAFIYAIENPTTITGKITLSSNLSQYLGYEFVPYFVSGSTVYSSSMYSKYGDINCVFEAKAGDTLVLYDQTGVSQTLEIVSSEVVNNRLEITTIPNFLANWVGNPLTITQMIIVCKEPDEQNVILTFNKPDGQTSYGFVIPETINPIVLSNINTLQASIQAQLLSTQTSTQNI